MKLIFVIKRLEDTSGGAERVFGQIAAGLTRIGHDVIVASFDSADAESFYPLASDVPWEKLKGGNSAQKTSAWDILVRGWRLRRLVSKERPAAVVAFMSSGYVLTALALIGTGIPVIASEHIVPTHYQDRKAEFRLVMMSAFLSRRMTVLSEEVKKLFPRLMQKRLVVMNNPVQHFPFTADPAGVNKSPKIVLSIGRMEAQKDQKTLIAAFARIARDFPDWVLRIVGTGPLQEDLARQADDLGVKDKVQFPGTTKNIGDEYKRAQIFVLPSLYESFGLVTAEAMSCGLPCIGFADCPGTNKLIVGGESGILVEPGDDRVAALAEALKTLMADPVKREAMGEQGQRLALTFDAEVIIGEWERLILKAVRG